MESQNRLSIPFPVASLTVLVEEGERIGEFHFEHKCVNGRLPQFKEIYIETEQGNQN